MTIFRDTSRPLSRRSLLGAAAVGAASVALSACSTVSNFPRYGERMEPVAPVEPTDSYALMYGPVIDEGYQVPGVPYERIPRQFLRQVVSDPTGERPGTIVVDLSSHFLYLVRENGQAMRYGVGLGRAGFEWSGRAVVQWKQKWPKWTPPD